MKTFKNLSLLIALILFLFINNNAYTQWQYDSKYGFKINIPSSWSKTSYMDGTDKVYDFYSPDENAAIQLRAFKATAGVTIDLLVQIYEQNMLPAGAQRQSLTNHTSKNGIPGKQGTYSMNYNGNEVILAAFYTVQNGNGFVLTAILPTSMVEQKGDEVRAITQSFTLDGFTASTNTVNKRPSGLSGLAGSTSSNSFKITGIKLSNKLDANNRAINPTTTFNTQTPEIFAVMNYTGGTQKDLIVSWIFNDWDRIISSDAYNFTNKKGGIGVVSVTKPNAGWPVGSYSVKFEMAGKIIRKLDFTVSKQSTGKGRFNGSRSIANSSSSSNQNNQQLVIHSHEAYDFHLGKVISFAKSTGEGFALYGGCEGLPKASGKFIVTNQNNFQNTTSWDKAKFSNVAKHDSKSVPLNRVCILELRDGTYGKFMFINEKQNDNGNDCERTITFQVEYPISGNSSRVSKTNIAGKYNFISRSDGKSLVNYHFIELRTNGTYHEEYQPKNSGSYVSKSDGTWKVTGNTLTLTFQSGYVSSTYKINRNKLIMTSDNGIVFTFIK